MDNLFVTIPERANYSVADPELLFYYEFFDALKMGLLVGNNLKFLRPRGDAAFPNCYSIKWFESVSNNLELLPKATVRFST